MACIVPTTNPDLTPAGNAIYAHQGARVVIFSPHPRSKKTSFETVRLMREALEREGAPADILQCLTKVNIPMSQALMARADVIMATGGQPMVRAAYSSGTPALRRGLGQLHDDHRRDRQHRGSGAQHPALQDLGLRLGLLRRRQPDHRGEHLRQVVAQLERRAATSPPPRRRNACARPCGTPKGTGRPTPWPSRRRSWPRSPDSPSRADRKFIMVHGRRIGKQHLFSSEKLTTLLALYKYKGSTRPWR